MKLIVGLGNPGKEYEHTRHNCGFDVLDLFGDMNQIEILREGFDGLYWKGTLFSQDVILLKPQTFMNLSGKSVQQIASFYKINLDDIVVVFDDMSILPGVIRMRKNGSSGGQKGMKNIIELLGSEEIKRIRIGIGEPKFNAVDWVLGKPKGDEAIAIKEAIENAAFALVDYLKTNFETSMSKHNGGKPIG